MNKIILVLLVLLFIGCAKPHSNTKETITIRTGFVTSNGDTLFDRASINVWIREMTEFAYFEGQNESEDGGD